jgi:hypothetical protein
MTFGEPPSQYIPAPDLITPFSLVKSFTGEPGIEERKSPHPYIVMSGGNLP